MAIFFFGINYFFFFVLAICLIPIIVGSPKIDKNYDPKENFTLRIHHECFDSIHRIFEVPLPPIRKWKKQYSQYAILYLRLATNEERDEYNQILASTRLPGNQILYNQMMAPGGHPVNLFLLYHGMDGTLYNDEFAHAYYNYLSTRFEVLRDNYHPYEFCKNFKDEEETCKHTLEKFGFVKENMDEIIKFAYTKIVIYDIENHDYIPEPNSTPIDEYFATEYLRLLHKKTSLKQGGNIKWPEDFCRFTYKYDRPIIQVQY